MKPLFILGLSAFALISHPYPPKAKGLDGFGTHFYQPDDLPRADTFRFQIPLWDYLPCGGGKTHLPMPPLFALNHIMPIGLHHSGSFTGQRFQFFNNPSGDWDILIEGNQIHQYNFGRFPSDEVTSEELPIEKSIVEWGSHSLDLRVAIKGPRPNEIFNIWHQIKLEGAILSHRISYHTARKIDLSKKKFQLAETIEIQFHAGNERTLVIRKFKSESNWLIYE